MMMVTVDILLNNGFPYLELPVLKVIASHMRLGSVVLGGNTGYMDIYRDERVKFFILTYFLIKISKIRREITPHS